MGKKAGLSGKYQSLKMVLHFKLPMVLHFNIPLK
jgi:hypothetical protein